MGRALILMAVLCVVGWLGIDYAMQPAKPSAELCNQKLQQSNSSAARWVESNKELGLALLAAKPANLEYLKTLESVVKLNETLAKSDQRAAQECIEFLQRQVRGAK